MKKVIQTIFKTLTFLVNRLSLINLRGLIVVGGVVLALFAPRVGTFQPLDKWVLKANSYLFKSPLGSSNIGIVSVPPEEIGIWQSDIHSSGNLALLLANLLNSANTKIGLILDRPVDEGSGAADVLIEELIQGRTSDDFKEVNALVDRKFILVDLLSNDRVVLGVKNFWFTGQKPIETESSYVDQAPAFIKRIVWPACESCFSPQNSVFAGRSEIPQYSAMTSSPYFFRALYSGDNGEMYGGFFVEFLRVVTGMTQEDHVAWGKESTLRLGKLNIPLSAQSQFTPLHALSGRLQPFITHMSLNEALARSAFPDVVLIADRETDIAERYAKALYATQHDAIIYSPWWQPAQLILLVLFLTAYLGAVIGRVSLRICCAVTAAMVVVCLVVQSTVLWTARIWLPMALPLLWLLAGHLLVMLWVIKKRRIQGLITRAENICIAQAKSLIKRKDLGKALAHLENCSTKDPLLQVLYDISDAYAEQKNFAKAIDVLRKLRRKRKSFKDTEQKLQVLKTMLKSQRADGHSGQLQETQVITSKQEQKSLGRYRLEREIGRGAMGRVYLGFDPRISRRVAIKTLHYDHFKSKEQQSLRERFFREAEAAGRLNHPSIVSVYDVGEDNDQAFIAMDFADGEALNKFVRPEALLPVFEVYRIVYDVAVALEYAHENNIVHRDVKPGNIIYNPTPYQIKVTDFGIARLTDDSKTSTGEILGSPLYMAPEQLKGKKVNRAADIFSLGVTFYQLLTGHLPYSGENLAALTYEIIHGKHKGVRTVRKELPASASRIINQALQKQANDRYETAAEMAIVLKKAIKRDFAVQAKRAGFI